MGEPLKGIYGTYPQASNHLIVMGLRLDGNTLHIKGLVLGMDGHSLVEVAYMLHRIRSTIVDGERWLIESSRKFCLFNLMREG